MRVIEISEFGAPDVLKIAERPDPVAAPGEVLIRGPHNMVPYWNRPDATAEKLRAGWYYTGDRFVRLAGGRVELKGRVDDVVRTGGENVHPEEVEAVLNDHPGVRESAVVGVADARWGQMVVACDVAHNGAPCADDLDGHCRAAKLAGFKRPRGYMFVDSLPRNATNKVLRRVLRETAAAARDGAGRFEEPGNPGSGAAG